MLFNYLAFCYMTSSTLMYDKTVKNVLGCDTDIYIICVRFIYLLSLHLRQMIQFLFELILLSSNTKNTEIVYYMPNLHLPEM